MRKRKKIKVGQKVIFDPLQYGISYIPLSAPGYVVGIITEVHNKHQWFLVEYEAPNNRILRMGFKFNDFGFRGKHRYSIVIPVSNIREEHAMRHYVYHGDLTRYYVYNKISMKGN